MSLWTSTNISAHQHAGGASFIRGEALPTTTNTGVNLLILLGLGWGGAGGAYPFVACVINSHIDDASLSTRSTGGGEALCRRCTEQIHNESRMQCGKTEVPKLQIPSKGSEKTVSPIGMTVRVVLLSVAAVLTLIIGKIDDYCEERTHTRL